MTTDPPSESGPTEPVQPTPPQPPPPPPPPPADGGYPSPPTGGYPQYPAGQQPPPGYGQPAGPQQSDSNTLSIIAIVLGGLAILFIPILLGPIAIILAVMAKRKHERLANTALIVAIGGMIAGFVIGAIVYSNGVA